VSDLSKLLDDLDAAREKATPGEWAQWVPRLTAALRAVEATYALQCPVQDPSAYMDPGAYAAHKWWETVLGGVLRDAATALSPEGGEQPCPVCGSPNTIHDATMHAEAGEQP